MCPAVHMQVWTHDLCFIWLSPKRPKGGVWPSKSYTKSRILKTPMDHPYRLCSCSERCPMEFFRSVLHKTKESYIYIYIYLSCYSHASLNPWPVHYLIKSEETYGWCLRVLCGMQHSDSPKVWWGFGVFCKLSPNQKAVGPWGCRDPTACFNCRKPSVNRIFSEVATGLWGPILPFLEIRTLLEHRGESWPALRYNGLVEWQAHAMPITLGLQPTILHSIFFFISLKIQQQTLFERFQRDQKLECGDRPHQRYTRLIIPKLRVRQQQVGRFWTSGQTSKGQTLK
jgi:hypothetical protein